MPIDNAEINALLGHGTEFSGKLTFEGTVRIDGKFDGEVFTSDVLIVGEGGEVRAEIDVGTLIVKGGVVVGNVRARDLVEIHAPGRLLGNIVSPSLFIGKGVVFDGHCQMGNPEAPESAAPQPPPDRRGAPETREAAAGTQVLRFAPPAPAAPFPSAQPPSRTR